MIILIVLMVVEVGSTVVPIGGRARREPVLATVYALYGLVIMLLAMIRPYTARRV